MRKFLLLLCLICVATISAAQRSGNLESLVFTGHFRAAPKTTMLSDSATEFKSVQAYLDAVVTPLNDNEVRSQFPEILNTDTDRIAPEQHVVKVHAKIYAVRLESDHDFHCIIGDSATGPFINAEFSGLPTQGDTQPFLSVRRALHQLVGDSGWQTATQRYYQPSPPIPVVVTGSLLYDAEHKPGDVGPTGKKVVTQWEIHPVSSVLGQGGQTTTGTPSSPAPVKKRPHHPRRGRGKHHPGRRHRRHHHRASAASPG